MEPLLLTDGTHLRVRPIRPSDREALATAFARLGPESRRRRFLAPKKALSEAELRRLTEIDHRSHEALVAIEAESRRGVAVARFAAHAGEPERSEFAITVADDWQGRGVGGALSRRLLMRAREEGVRVLEASVLADNHSARALLGGLGFEVCSVASGVAELRLSLGHPRAVARGRELAVHASTPRHATGNARSRIAIGSPASGSPRKLRRSS
jgi:GNAT superfamily N-acetyltransferase